MLRDAIEDFKQRMPCGFPEYGLPPLAPYKTEHAEVGFDTDVLQAHGEVTDFRLYGLNDFDIVTLRVQVLLGVMNFKFNWNDVYFKTNYNVTAAPGGMGLRRYGPAIVSFRNAAVWGVIKYNFNIFSGKVNVKKLSVYVSLGEVKSEIQGLSTIQIINKKINRLIEEWIMLAVNDNTNHLAEYTNNEVLPVVNDFLSDKTSSDLLGMAGSGGSKQPCIPPEEED